MTTGLATGIMFNDTPRVGVVQHLTVAEYERMNRRADSNVLWIMKHKLGVMRPATLVLNDTLTALTGECEKRSPRDDLLL